MKNKRLKHCLPLLLTFVTLTSCGGNSTEDNNKVTNSSSNTNTSSTLVTSGISTSNSSSSVSHTHQYSEWKVTKNPTVSSTGTIEKSCTICNEKETSTLPALNEKDYELSITKKATCSLKGTGKYTYNKDNQKIEIDVEIEKNSNYHVDVDENSICTACNTAVDLTFESNDFNDTDNTCAVSAVKNSPTTMIIPDTVTKGGKTYTVNKIKESAFFSCSTIESIELSDNITTCGPLCFGSCTSLKSVKLSNKLETLTYTFYGCTSLENITLPDSLLTIGDGVFTDCTSLKYIDIPNNVTEIGNSAFENCTNLEYILIPVTIKAVASTFNSKTTAVLFVKATKEKTQTNDYFSRYAGEFDWIYYSETEPSDTTTKYWHYDENNKPVKW